MNSRVEPWHEHCHGSISPASMKRMMSRLTSERMDHHSTSSGRGCWEHHFLGKLCMLIWCCVCVNYIYILIWSSIWIKNNSIHTYIYIDIYICIMGGVIHIYICVWYRLWNIILWLQYGICNMICSPSWDSHHHLFKSLKQIEGLRVNLGPTRKPYFFQCWNDPKASSSQHQDDDSLWFSLTSACILYVSQSTTPLASGPGSSSALGVNHCWSYFERGNHRFESCRFSKIWETPTR